MVVKRRALLNALITKTNPAPRKYPCRVEVLGGDQADRELDSGEERHQYLSFLVAINYDSIDGFAKATDLRGVFV